MNNTRLVWRNMNQVLRDLDSVDTKRVKSAQVAAKVEAYRLRGKLWKEVRESRPAGRKLAPLSIIARYTKTGKLKKLARKPLAVLARMIRVKTTRPGGQINVEVGFVAPAMESKGWKRLVGVLQSGGRSMPAGTLKDLGKRLAQIGGKLKKKGNKAAARFFFLRQGSQIGNVPARQIVDPFWERNRPEATQNILRNWKRKMAGERI